MKRMHKMIGLAILVGAGLPGIAQSQGLQPTFEEVMAAIAARTGVARDELDPDQDLVDDLFLDQADAFQLFAELCDEFERPLPSGDGITRVRDIAVYIVESRPNVVPRGAPGAPGDGESEQRIATLYYATDRARTGSDDPADFYGGDRSPNGQIHYGRTEVAIPRSHRVGRLESPFLGLRTLSSPKRHVTIQGVTPLSRDRFWSAIAADLRLIDDGRIDILVFIHGFRVVFEDAARRTAQIVVDMADAEVGLPFVPVFFSWPSDGTLLGYLSDREDVTWSAAHMEEFLLDLYERSPGARIHLVAHSMGAQGLLTALRILARNNRSGSEALFENVLLAAPDFDAEIFQQQLARDYILRVSRRWTVYTSDRDSALKASVGINSARRLGLPIIAVDGVDMIDATGLEVSPWNVPEFHSYFATKQAVISDVASVFSGVPPATRRLLRERLGELTYWRLTSPDSER
ncbi:MAG TPA: alpha/beta fold hydrolase [Vicinamibacterales bacterium]|nr:alpha/beta fold hydrolase [Vicinamibacterales bacterium]